MSRFQLGKGLFILRQGLTLRFCGRTDFTLHFAEVEGSKILEIDERLFWREVEQRQISLLARALKDPIPMPSTTATYNSNSAEFVYLPHHLGKSGHMSEYLPRHMHVVAPRVNAAPVSLIASVIRQYCAEAHRIPAKHLYKAHYLPAVTQLNADRVQAGLEALRPVSLRTFRRHLAASVNTMPNPAHRKWLHGLTPARAYRMFPDKPVAWHNVEVVPLTQLQLTAVIDRYSRRVLEIHISFKKPPTKSRPTNGWDSE